jgi:hypothetical protein
MKSGLIPECGIYERTHNKPRPQQQDDLKLRRNPTPPPTPRSQSQSQVLGAEDGEVVSYPPPAGGEEHLSLELGLGAQAEALVREGDQVEVEVDAKEIEEPGDEYTPAPLSRSSFSPLYILLVANVQPTRPGSTPTNPTLSRYGPSPIPVNQGQRTNHMYIGTLNPCPACPAIMPIKQE